jgi:hypothetical protein
MKKLVLSIVALAVVSAVWAAQKVNPEKEELLKIGGEGKVAIVNACEAPVAPLEMAARKIGNLLMIFCDVQKGVWKFADAQKSFDGAKANVAVFVVNDASLPLSLIAMEAKWGVVNAAGLTEKSLEKEILRVATIVLGGGSSKYSASTMRPVFSKEDLETKAGQVITFDSLMSIYSYIPSLGLKQYQMMTREDAEAEGLVKKEVK